VPGDLRSSAQRGGCEHKRRGDNDNCPHRAAILLSASAHANPLSDERDLRVIQVLVKAFAQQQPTFGVGMRSAAGGQIRVGDTVVPA
jgi:hypothetical protein